MTLSNERLSSRDHRAWADIFDKLDTLGEEVRSLRTRIAHELGFERCKVQDLRTRNAYGTGDRVRDSATGAWYEVAYVLSPKGQPTDTTPVHRIHFLDGEGSMEVEAQWDGNPWPAMVTRAVEITEEPF